MKFESAPKSEFHTCKCGKPVEYAAVPCGHPLACKKCAMKLASGGRCRHCGDFYGGVKSLARGDDGDSDDGDANTEK